MTTSPTTRKGRATRDRIVDAACDLVFERGVAGLNLDEVREATDTSKSQLYHYFKDKSDLIKAVVDRQAERVLDVHRPELAELDESSRLRLSDVFAEWEGMIAHALQRMVDSGELATTADAKQLSIAMMASLQGGFLLSKTSRSVRPLEVALDAAFDYVKAVASP